MRTRDRSGGVFINYRGDDSTTTAELLDRDLAAEFGRDRVFLDCRSIRAGNDFAQELLEEVRRSRVLLVLIGPRWSTLTNADGVKRIDDPADWVRREIAEAFEAGVRVVPVLLDDAPRPSVDDQLPAEISALAGCQAVVVRRRHTEADVRELIRRLVEAEPGLVAAKGTSGGAAAGKIGAWGGSRLPKIVVVLGIILVVSVCAIAVRQWTVVSSGDEPAAGPPNGQGSPPETTSSPPLQGGTIDNPCPLVGPDLFEQTYGVPPLHIEERGYNPAVGGPLPGDARMVQDLTCSLELPGSAGRLEVRLVDLGDQPSTKSVFEQFGREVSAPGVSQTPVPDCGDECRQVPGKFVARKANRVLLFVDVPSDVAAPRSPSLELMARGAVSRS